MTDGRPGWGYFNGRILVDFKPNHDGTILRFYFGNGMKLTATAMSDEARNEVCLVKDRRLTKMQQTLNKSPLVCSGAIWTGIVMEAASNNKEQSSIADVLCTMTLRGTINYTNPRLKYTERKNHEVNMTFRAQSDPHVDSYPSWEWSLHDTLFKEEG